MAMTLQAALDIAARYTDSKNTDNGYNCVLIRDGMVRATNGNSGCEIPCSDVEGIDFALDCAALRKMIKAIGDAAFKPSKGRKLEITGPGVKYHLKKLPSGSEPTFPDIPKDGWRELSKPAALALAAISTLIDEGVKQQQFAGVRLTPDWCAAAQQVMMGFAWVQGIVDAPFTCPPAVLDDLNSECEVAVVEGKLFVRVGESEHVRWTLGIQMEWPDDSLSSMLANCRGGRRGTASIKLPDLALLCKQASVVADSKVDSFKLRLSGEGLGLSGAQGTGAFDGAIGVEDYTDGEEASRHLGVSPELVQAISTMVAVSGGSTFVSVADPLSPMMIWSTDTEIAIEGIVMPIRL